MIKIQLKDEYLETKRSQRDHPAIGITLNLIIIASFLFLSPCIGIRRYTALPDAPRLMTFNVNPYNYTIIKAADIRRVFSFLLEAQ